MDSEVQQFIIQQLLVIILPVGSLFGIWVWMLTLRDNGRR